MPTAECRSAACGKACRASSASRCQTFPYSLACSPEQSMALVGCGNGAIVAVDLTAGAEAYTLHCSSAAVRTLSIGSSGILAAGDDGSMRYTAW